MAAMSRPFSALALPYARVACCRFATRYDADYVLLPPAAPFARHYRLQSSRHDAYAYKMRQKTDDADADADA